MRKELGIFLVGRHFDLCPFQFINLPVDCLELLVVGRTEVFAAGHRSYCREGLFVEIDLHHLAANPERGLHGKRGHPLCADAHCVDPNAERRRDLRRGDRIDLPAVVHAVRQENHNLALRLAVLEPVHSVRNCEPDGRTVSDHAIFHLVQEASQHRIVKSQRTLSEALCRKDHESDPVVRSPLDELVRNLLGRDEPVGRKILRQHASRDIENEHNVDSLCGKVLLA